MRRLALLLSVAGALALPGTAQAAVTASNITTPLGGTVQDNGSGGFVVRGTAVGSGSLRVVCYTGYGNDYRTLNNATATVSSGTFATGVQLSDLPAGPCLLRAIPTGSPPADPTPFAGPHLVVNWNAQYRNVGGPNSGALNDFFIAQQQGSGLADYLSVSSCGLCDMRLLNDPANLLTSAFLFYGNAALYASEGLPSADRAYAQIDSHNVLFSFAASSEAPNAANAPALSYSTSVDPASGDLSITEDEDAARCATDVLPYGTGAGQNACTGGLISTGVHLHRTMLQTSNGLLVRIVDVWSSTDGQAHALNLDYDQYFKDSVSAPAYEPSFSFPWAGGGYAVHNLGDTIPAAPSGPATIFVRGNSTAADGDTTYPQGAITADPAPNGASFNGTSTNQHKDFALNFQRTVPAGGSTAIKQTFAIGSTAAAVQALASQAEDQQEPPTISLSGPANSSTPTVTLSGTAGDSRHLSGVTVNGAAVAVGADGSFSVTEPLQPGANSFKAVASDGAGNQTSATAAVTYTPPAPTTSTTPSKTLDFKIAGVSLNPHGVISLKLTSPAAGKFNATARTPSRTLRAKRRGKPTNRYGSGSFSAAGAGTVTLRVKPGKAALRALRGGRRLHLRVQITFTPTGSGTSIVHTRSVRTRKYHR